MFLNKILTSVDKKYKYIKSTGISFDTRSIKKGNIFFAIKGNKNSGKNFIDVAIKKKRLVLLLTKILIRKNIKYQLLK